jgi:hypothetical protein
VPLAALPSDARRAVEQTLASYARALETADEALLARVRPDLPPEAREARLRPFRGAINAAADIRILDVAAGADAIVVSVVRTDIAVGGRVPPGPPAEETLRFARDGTAWVLR